VGGLYRLDQVDEIARAAENDVTEAAQLLESELQKKRALSAGMKTDWPDQLLSHLLHDPSA
jgi:hypothetical protein